MFGAPPQCGERYAHLLTVNGNTSDAPCGVLTMGGAGCFYFHAQAWERRADEVWYLVRAAWNELIRRENAQQQWSGSNQLRAQVEEFERAASNMERYTVWKGTVAGGLDYNKSIVDGAIAVISLGACCLERLNAAIEASAGGTIEPGMSPESSPLPSFLPEGIGPIVIAALFAFGLFAWSRRGET